MANRKLIYYIFISTILASIATIYFVYLPIIKGINDTKNTAETKKEELFGLQKREKKLKTLSADYNNYKAKIDILNGMFPKEKDVSQYLTQVQSAGINSRVEIKGLKILSQAQQEKKPADKYTQMAKKNELYELSMEATIVSPNYSNIVTMVKTIEQVSRYTTINKVTIKNDATGSEQLEAVINFKIYVL